MIEFLKAINNKNSIESKKYFHKILAEKKRK
jgi:hypothetical protein